MCACGASQPDTLWKLLSSRDQARSAKTVDQRIEEFQVGAAAGPRLSSGYCSKAGAGPRLMLADRHVYITKRTSAVDDARSATREIRTLATPNPAGSTFRYTEHPADTPLSAGLA